jgi:CBS domain-containing protein
MKIAVALPNIFKRTYPVLESGTQLLLAASLLRFHQIDAIPIGFKKKQKNHLAVLGYSCLSHLLKTDPGLYMEFLEQPCENAAQELSAISADDDVEDLLDLFYETKFGFAMVEGKFELGALVSLRDLLGLFKNKFLATTLTIDQIASPIFSMDSSSTLRDLLTEMFQRRFRRIFLDNPTEGKVITDRRLISYIFSTSRLDELAQHHHQNLLDTSADKLETMRPIRLKGRTKVSDAANVMTGEIEECLVSKKGVVTPWDVLLKPWKMGQLSLKSKVAA